MFLKEQCHKDFAVLGQFCAKSLLWDLNHKQNASIKLRQRYQTIFIRDGCLEHVASKFEKIGQFFKFQSISIHAIRSDRWQGTFK